MFRTLVMKFFNEPDITKPSFPRGVDIGGRSIRFVFKGVLADEKGLKEIFDVRTLVNFERHIFFHTFFISEHHYIFQT